MYEENKRELPMITVSTAPLQGTNYQAFFAEKLGRAAMAFEKVLEYLETVKTNQTEGDSSPAELAKTFCGAGLHCVHSMSVLVNNGSERDYDAGCIERGESL